jgi:hypothetical protein
MTFAAVSAMIVFTVGAANALVVCAKDDGTGQPKAKSKLSIETECELGKKVQIGIAYDPTTATVELSKTRVTGDLDVESGNLQVASGVGATDGVPNGKGNIIVGYNEASFGQARTGSHNVVIGKEHTYSSFSGLVVGHRNTISGSASSVTGGSFNTASGPSSSVSGGSSNVSSDSNASISGGSVNASSGIGSSVSGGYKNLASGDYSAVGGGNTVSSTVYSEWHAGQVGGFPTGTKY